MTSNTSSSSGNSAEPDPRLVNAYLRLPSFQRSMAMHPMTSIQEPPTF